EETTVVPLLRTQDTSWARKDVIAISPQLQLDAPPGEHGPYLVAAAVKGRVKSHFEGRPRPPRGAAPPPTPPPPPRGCPRAAAEPGGAATARRAAKARAGGEPVQHAHRGRDRAGDRGRHVAAHAELHQRIQGGARDRRLAGGGPGPERGARQDDRAADQPSRDGHARGRQGRQHRERSAHPVRVRPRLLAGAREPPARHQALVEEIMFKGRTYLAIGLLVVVGGITAWKLLSKSPYEHREGK